jgi:hypothetical protein
LDLDYYKDSERGHSFKEVIDALNAALNLKEVYERNKILIKETKGQKGVYSWFPTYFMKAWEEQLPYVEKEFDREFEKVKDITLALSNVLD